MHEMALAEGILDIALDYAKQNDAKKINEIGLLIGEMSGVEIESLTFSFDMIVKGTIAEGAELKIKHVPLMGKCSKVRQGNSMSSTMISGARNARTAS
jgi:hydrogenase nickel incorporation protein HypA/HybF